MSSVLSPVSMSIEYVNASEWFDFRLLMQHTQSLYILNALLVYVNYWESNDDEFVHAVDLVRKETEKENMRMEECYEMEPPVNP